ncbi:hypothetical protein AKJ16_DCAP16105 [Drosera capensis]
MVDTVMKFGDVLCLFEIFYQLVMQRWSSGNLKVSGGQTCLVHGVIAGVQVEHRALGLPDPPKPKTRKVTLTHTHHQQQSFSSPPSSIIILYKTVVNLSQISAGQRRRRRPRHRLLASSLCKISLYGLRRFDFTPLPLYSTLDNQLDIVCRCFRDRLFFCPLEIYPSGTWEEWSLNVALWVVGYMVSGFCDLILFLHILMSSQVVLPRIATALRVKTSIP